LVERIDRAAGELDLATRLERDGEAVAGESDGRAVLFARRPAESFGEADEQALDAPRTAEWRRATRPRVDRELLVLGPDLPFGPRLRRGVELLDQLIDALDRDRVRARTKIGHAARDAIRTGLPSQGRIPRATRRLTLRV